MQFPRRWCGWCMTFGVLLFMWGADAFAQSSPPSSPDYADWFKIVVGLLIAVIGAYAKGLESRITKAEACITAGDRRTTDLREQLAGQHYDKEEIDRRFDRIEQLMSASRVESSAGIAALHRRLDFLRVPPSPRVYYQDDGA